MNDKERKLWVQNDEGLYNIWRGSGRTLASFIKHERKFIDHVIDNMANGRKPQHYLAYSRV